MEFPEERFKVDLSKPADPDGWVKIGPRQWMRRGGNVFLRMDPVPHEIDGDAWREPTPESPTGTESQGHRVRCFINNELVHDSMEEP